MNFGHIFLSHLKQRLLYSCSLLLLRSAGGLFYRAAVEVPHWLRCAADNPAAAAAAAAAGVAAVATALATSGGIQNPSLDAAEKLQAEERLGIWLAAAAGTAFALWRLVAYYRSQVEERRRVEVALRAYKLEEEEFIKYGHKKGSSGQESPPAGPPFY
ncbi:hypothetical protein cyc_06181 [Cyclospora cayetanensis]|uniref:Transmembrane protein n=1 Tax=Cyclospora cayetanensis TaxID=88456 RepID=A0A1D3D7F4_9EIME|nr:hypothetical protein cyc_06181 [Cyclospora cayetanensis]